METEAKKELLTRTLMLIGGTITLIFGLLTAFIPNLAYMVVVTDWNPPPHLYYLRPLSFPDSPFLYLSPPFACMFLGLLVTSFGGFLGLVSAVKHDGKLAPLGSIGSLLGILGLLRAIPSGQPPFTMLEELFDFEGVLFYVPWVGVCLTLVGVSFMLVSSAAKGNRVQRLTLLGIPLLMASWLIYPFLIATNNIPFLISIGKYPIGSNASASILIGTFAILGFGLTLLGITFSPTMFYVRRAGAIIRKELKEKSFTCPLIILGGSITLVFGLLTALAPSLAYIFAEEYREDLEYNFFNLNLHYDVRIALWFFFFQPFFGLLMSSFGGFLSLISVVKRNGKFAYLGFAGNFLGVFGLILAISSFKLPFSMLVTYDVLIRITAWQFFAVPLVGFCLTSIGVSLMLISSAVRYRGFQLLTLLGVPLILASCLIYPLLIIINNHALIRSIYWSTSVNILIRALAISGFALTLSGNIIGIWKFRADLKRIMYALH